MVLSCEWISIVYTYPTDACACKKKHRAAYTQLSVISSCSSRRCSWYACIMQLSVFWFNVLSKWATRSKLFFHLYYKFICRCLHANACCDRADLKYMFLHSCLTLKSWFDNPWYNYASLLMFHFEILRRSWQLVASYGRANDKNGSAQVCKVSGVWWEIQWQEETKNHWFLWSSKMFFLLSAWQWMHSLWE
jgi:hypothetical protein